MLLITHRDRPFIMYPLSPFPAQAAAYIEPLSFRFVEPLPPTVPSLAIGTAYCEDKPDCCIPGLDYVKLYSDLHCPRLSFNVTVSGQQLSSQHHTCCFECHRYVGS